MADTGFDLALSIGISDAARQRDCAVVRQHIAVERIQRRIVDVRLEHAFAQVVEDDHPYRTTQSTESFLVQFGPDLSAGMEGEQSDRLAAVAQRHHEQAHTPVLARYGITHHRAVAIVHLPFFTRCGDDDCTRFQRLDSAQLSDVAFDALVCAGESTLIDQVLPDSHGIAAAGDAEFDQFVEGFTGTRGRAPGWRWLNHWRPGFGAEVGGHLYGRF